MLTARLVKLSALGLANKLNTAVLYSARFSVYPNPELTTVQAFILVLFRSFQLGDAPAVFSLLPLVPQLPQLQSPSLEVWFREDFLFKRQDVVKALSWLAHFIKKEGPVVPQNVLLVFSSLEEKYEVFKYFQEVGDIIGQDMLVNLNPRMSRTTHDRHQNMKDQRVESRPEMVSIGTQTNMAMSKETIRTLPLNASNLKDPPVVYAALQSVESIQTEVIYEELENFNEPTSTKTIPAQKHNGLLTFLVQSDRSRPLAAHPPPMYSEVQSNRPLPSTSFQPPPYSYEDPVADGPSTVNTSTVLERRRPSVKLRQRSSERPRSLQPNEVLSPEVAQGYATTSRARPSSYIETLTQEKDRIKETTFVRSNSTLERPMKSSTQKRAMAAAKADATRKLMKAAELGDARAVVAAIAEGANIDQRDSVRRTPLHLAVVGGHEDVVKRLIEAGADKDKKDSMGRTPLHYTALRGRIDCAQILLNGGADPNQRDASGLTPTALASMKHHSGVATVLKRKGGQDCSIS